MNWPKWRTVWLTGGRVVQAFVPAKRKWQIISLLVVVLLLGSNAQRRTGDWQAVKNLQPGARIMVKTQHRYPCIFLCRQRRTNCSAMFLSTGGLVCPG